MISIWKIDLDYNLRSCPISGPLKTWLGSTYKHEESPVGPEHLLFTPPEGGGGQIQTLLSVHVTDLQQKKHPQFHWPHP